MAASLIAPTATEMPLSRPLLVLDTNVILGWLVFRDPRVAHLARALETGQVCWVACPRMREELRRTLGYPALSKWLPDSERSLTLFDRLARLLPDPAASQASPLLCSDADDQVFVELALAVQADWLLTRDRALLKLGARAARHGLKIGTPETWAAAPLPTS